MLLVDGDNIGVDGLGNKPKIYGLSDSENYESEDLDSDCRSDGEDGEARKKFPTFKMPEKMRDYNWELGTYFKSKKDFQDGMRTYDVHSAREIKFDKNDKRRVKVICKQNCKWEAYCAKIPGEETWQLRKIGPKHTCSRGNKLKLMNSEWLGKKLNTSVCENPNMRLEDIMNKTKRKWGIGISKTKAYKARSYAIDLVDGSFRDQYKRMYDYAHELRRSNPHSTVKIAT